MTPEPRAPLPSLVAVTIRRAVVAGRLYLALGTALALLLALVLLRSKNGVFAATFPLELPLFASLGAMGGLMLFVSDRGKGVLEYMIAYGIRPWALFANFLFAAVALATLVLGSALLVGIGAYLAAGNTLTWDLEQSLLLYSIPMTYAGVLFSSVAGMIWSTLSTPRAGLNSPAGVAPLLAVAPPVLVLVIAEAAPRAEYYDITASAAAAFLVVVVVLLVAAGRIMGRERFLSPM
jgi:hypothetical protein